jgi:hypothetical protein
MLMLFALSCWLRRSAPDSPTSVAIVLGVVALLFGLVGGWLGGELVYRLCGRRFRCSCELAELAIGKTGEGEQKGIITNSVTPLFACRAAASPEGWSFLNSAFAR